jgi:hypothetical protein
MLPERVRATAQIGDVGTGISARTHETPTHEARDRERERRASSRGSWLEREQVDRPYNPGSRHPHDQT